MNALDPAIDVTIPPRPVPKLSMLEAWRIARALGRRGWIPVERQHGSEYLVDLARVIRAAAEQACASPVASEGIGDGT